MNRLRDAAGDDPTSQQELDRLRNTPPTPPMPDMKRRVWNELQQQARGRASSSGWGMPSIRVLAMGATVVVLAGTAGAMITGRWTARVLHPSVRSSDSVLPGRRVEKPRTTRRFASAPTRDVVPPQAPPVMAPALAPPAAPFEPKGHRAGAASDERAAVRVAAGPAHPVTSAAQAHTEVLDALVALRRDHDPVRAGALLDRYLALHERGALREEALVLAIEAADARGDRLPAQRLARAYEAEYPQGRFRQFARSHTKANSALPPEPSTFSFDGDPPAPPPSQQKN